MDELIKKQKEVVAALQERALERLNRNASVEHISVALSRAVEDLNTLLREVGSVHG